MSDDAIKIPSAITIRLDKPHKIDLYIKVFRYCESHGISEKTDSKLIESFIKKSLINNSQIHNGRKALELLEKLSSIQESKKVLEEEISQMITGK